MSLDRDTTVGTHLRLQARNLSCGELIHEAIKTPESIFVLNGLSQMTSPVVSVVHVVVDGVNTGAGASIATSRAAGCVRCLSGGVGNIITRSRASALEGVVEADPVTGLVCQSLAGRIRTKI